MSSRTIGPNRTHGIRSTYTDGCRCRPCKRSEAEYTRLLRAREGRPERSQRQKPEFRADYWSDRASCKGREDFFDMCCTNYKKERDAFTPKLRAICNACPVLQECADDVMYWESFHPDKDRALFQAAMWPHERVEEAKVRRIAESFKRATA